MPPDVHLDPVLLRAVAAAVDGLRPVLRVPALDPGDLDALARAPGGSALIAEQDRLVAAVARVDGELAELVTGLDATADRVGAADTAATRALRLW